MKVSRWIYFPLIYFFIYIPSFVLMSYLFDTPISSFKFLVWLLQGLFTGFLILFFSDIKARKLTENDERVFEVEQNRELTLLLDKEKSFKFCREAILLQKRGKILIEDFQKGEIKGYSRLENWNHIGEKIDIILTSLNENLTQVKVFVYPSWKTVIISSGNNWKIVEEICKYLNEKDAEINKKVLVESTTILDVIYVKPFHKEKADLR